MSCKICQYTFFITLSLYFPFEFMKFYENSFFDTFITRLFSAHPVHTSRDRVNYEQNVILSNHTDGHCFFRVTSETI